MLLPIVQAVICNAGACYNAAQFDRIIAFGNGMRDLKPQGNRQSALLVLAIK